MDYCECIHCECFWDSSIPCCWCGEEPDWDLDWDGDDPDDDDDSDQDELLFGFELVLEGAD